MIVFSVTIPDPFKLPRLPLAHKKQLPKEQGLYFVFQNSLLLYIGKTESGNGFKGRWANHHRFEQLKRFHGVEIAYWTTELRREELGQLETRAIAKFEPLLNQTKVDSPVMGVESDSIKVEPDSIEYEIMRQTFETRVYASAKYEWAMLVRKKLQESDEELNCWTNEMFGVDFVTFYTMTELEFDKVFADEIPARSAAKVNANANAFFTKTEVASLIEKMPADKLSEVIAALEKLAS